MNLKWKYVLFDMDGTLVDSEETVISRYVATFNHFGIQIPEKSELKKLLGPSAIMSMTKYLGTDLANDGVFFFRELAKKDGFKGISLFPGVADLVSKLHNEGICLSVATSKPEIEAIKILDHLDISGFFSFVSGASDIHGIHSKTDVIKRAIQELSISSNKDVLMVGDRIFDVEGARNIGIPCVFVDWAGTDIQEAEGSIGVAHTPSELEEFILRSKFI